MSQVAALELTNKRIHQQNVFITAVLDSQGKLYVRWQYWPAKVSLYGLQHKLAMARVDQLYSIC